MRRQYRFYLEDMLSAARRIVEYVGDLSMEAFFADMMCVDAVLRNLEVMGEAASRVPIEVRDRYPQIEWRKMADFRNILIHEYFGVSPEIVWDVIRNKLPSQIGHLETALKHEQ
jgi:uncharacterized protein with HEPN domain